MNFSLNVKEMYFVDVKYEKTSPTTAFELFNLSAYDENEIFWLRKTKLVHEERITPQMD